MSCPHWKQVWDDTILPVARGTRVLLACDFDGTLSPIAATPWDAELPDNTREILQRLSLCPGVELAFVSGRELSDLRERIGLEGVTYSGNHGMQMEGPDFQWESSDARNHRPALTSALAELQGEVSGIEGVIVEDKGLTASIHWRLVSEPERQNLHLTVATVATKYPDLRLTHGKAVWEFRPQVRRNKGTAIQQLLEKTGLSSSQTFFLGDDDTDEAAFQVLGDGLTVRVGKPAQTFARFSAENPHDVTEFLFCLFMERVGLLSNQELLINTSKKAAA